MTRLALAAALLALAGCSRDPAPPPRPTTADLPKLLGDLKSADAGTRAAGAAAVAILGEQAADAVPALHAVLKDADPRVREEAANALGQIGPAAKAAAPDLLRLVNDPDEDVRTVATTALRRVDPEAAGRAFKK